MSRANIVAVTDATFNDQVLKASCAVLLKLEADWCGPCQAMKPLIGEIAEQYAGKLQIATLDVDQNSRTTYELGVRGIPTVILFKDGKILGQKTGLARKADLTALIDSTLS